MEQRRVGASGLRISRLGLGTLTWGRDTDEHECADSLRAFLTAGGTLLDTAPGYGDGVAEEVVGKLLDKLADPVADRDELVLATKGGMRPPVADGRSDRRGAARRVDVSRKGLLDALDASLRRLRTDRVDLWQVHTWSEGSPLDETLSALDTAVSSGRARYVGVCNYSGWQTAHAVTLQRSWPGRTPLVSTQVEYSLVQRGVEREVLPAAEFLGVGVLPWSPLGRGVLTGKYRHGTPADSRAASPRFSSYVERYLDDRSRRVVDAVCTAAEGLGIAPAHVALAWVRDAPGVSAPLLGARTAAQLRAILPAEEVGLPAEIRAALDDASAPHLGYPDAGRLRR